MVMPPADSNATVVGEGCEVTGKPELGREPMADEGEKEGDRETEEGEEDKVAEED